MDGRPPRPQQQTQHLVLLLPTSSGHVPPPLSNHTLQMVPFDQLNHPPQSLSAWQCTWTFLTGLGCLPALSCSADPSSVVGLEATKLTRNIHLRYPWISSSSPFQRKRDGSTQPVRGAPGTAPTSHQLHHTLPHTRTASLRTLVSGTAGPRQRYLWCSSAVPPRPRQLYRRSASSAVPPVRLLDGVVVG